MKQRDLILGEMHIATITIRANGYYPCLPHFMDDKEHVKEIPSHISFNRFVYLLLERTKAEPIDFTCIFYKISPDRKVLQMVINAIDCPVFYNMLYGCFHRMHQVDSLEFKWKN